MTTDKAAPPDDIKALFFHLWDAVLAVHCGYRLGGSVLAAAQAERERAREQMEGAGNPEFLPEWRAEWEQSRLHSELAGRRSKAARIAAEAEALYEALDALTEALVWQCPATDDYRAVWSSRHSFENGLGRAIEYSRAVLRRIEDATNTP